MTAHRKPTAGFWITVALVAVLVGYPLSFGPVCWITSYSGIGSRLLPMVYHPITWTFGDQTSTRGRAPAIPALGRILQAYANLAARRTWGWTITYPSDGPYYWEWMEWDIPEIPPPTFR
jgi:hypothetical protein